MKGKEWTLKAIGIIKLGAQCPDDSIAKSASLLNQRSTTLIQVRRRNSPIVSFYKYHRQWLYKLSKTISKIIRQKVIPKYIIDES
jgi:hypothetical protein